MRVCTYCHGWLAPGNTSGFCSRRCAHNHAVTTAVDEREDREARSPTALNRIWNMPAYGEAA